MVLKTRLFWACQILNAPEHFQANWILIQRDLKEILDTLIHPKNLFKSKYGAYQIHLSTQKLTWTAATTSTGSLESYGQFDCFTDKCFRKFIISSSLFQLLSTHHQDINDRVESQGLLISGQVRATGGVEAELMQLLP
jgi:hypothetical protein